MFKWLLIALLVIIAALGGVLVWLCLPTAAPPQVTVTNQQEMAGSPNVTVYVHQSAVNDMLQAMFPFEGKGIFHANRFRSPTAGGWKIRTLR